LTKGYSFAIINPALSESSRANLENDTEKRNKSHSEAGEIPLKKEKEQSDSERVKRLKESGRPKGFGESEGGNEEVR